MSDIRVGVACVECGRIRQILRRRVGESPRCRPCATRLNGLRRRQGGELRDWTGEETAWLAGLLEGEGCFVQSRYPRIQLSMVDRDIVERAARMMEAGVREPRVRPPRLPQFLVSPSGARAVTAMKRILPHMGGRRSKKIASILAEYGDEQ